jgi:hypothetical protein
MRFYTLSLQTLNYPQKQPDTSKTFNCIGLTALIWYAYVGGSIWAYISFAQYVPNVNINENEANH